MTCTLPQTAGSRCSDYTRFTGFVAGSDNVANVFLQQNIATHNPSNDSFFSSSHLQSDRNRKRRDRHQIRMHEKARRERACKRRMLWNRVQREARIAAEVDAERTVLPTCKFEAQPGQVRIGCVNMEKHNPDKLECLVRLAAARGWEVTLVSECAPTTRRGNSVQTTCRHWKWEGCELIHTGSVGILLDPSWSAAWHVFSAPKCRSQSGRVLSVALPRDPMAKKGDPIAVWVASAVWAPVSTSPLEELDDFWDEVGAVASGSFKFTPQTPLAKAVHEFTPHVVAGDFNAQLYEQEGDDLDIPSGVLGQYRPRNRHMLDEYAFGKVVAMGDWVHADSHRPALGNRHRCTWHSAVHKKWYELDWMLLAKRHLPRLVSII